MIIREIEAKTVLSKSKVFDYAVNPYVGCEHGCTYCYARFMKRVTGHKEPWGKFVDVKINAPVLLQREIRKRRMGRVWVSGTCDPYQPLERKYEITRKCLEVLLRHKWPITIQTKSPLVLRDLELLKMFHDIEVGFTITTADENTRKIFEPNAPSVKDRVKALEILHSARLKTFAMIAPLLPNAENLALHLVGKVDYVLVDKMNYHYADWVYNKNGLEYARKDEFFENKKLELVNAFRRENIACKLLF
jgi:DNA repair photolyase